MAKTRTTKKALLSSVIALLLCFSMLLGTTYAWFTDSVTSVGNVIQSGTLRIDLLHKTENGWISLKKTTDHKIFNYAKWEPGFTGIETVKAENLGNLALQYRLSLSVEDGTATVGPNGEKLADVIEVYVTEGESAAADFEEIKATWQHKGTLTAVMQDPAKFLGGELLPAGQAKNAEDDATTAEVSQIVSIALHMKKEAGNEYQKLSVGNVYVNLIATQWSRESDAFGADFDNDALFPLTPGVLYYAASPVTADGDGKVASDVTVGSTADTGSAVVPAGVKLAAGATEVALELSIVANREAVVEMKGGDVAIPLDVHMDGVAADNTTPILVTVTGVFPKHYADYNIRLFHVENGATVAMTSVASAADLDAHNEYFYDPATGNVTVAMATFSEVTAAVTAGNAWDGKTVDTSWYNTTDTEFTLTTADQLAGFAQIVGGMAQGIERDSFAGKTVKLGASVNLGSINSTEENPVIFTPVGYYFTNDKNGNSTPNESKDDVYSDVFSFEGTFDGQNHTVSNILQRTWDIKGDDKWYNVPTEQYYNDGMGLFGFVYNGTVKNLTVDNFQSDGEFCTTGCVAAYASGSSNFENITVINSNPRAYNVPNGGVVGYAYAEAEADANVINFTNVKVDNSNKISALWGTYDAGCGGILGRVNGATTVNMTDCEVGAVLDVYNDVCGNYQYYQYRYSGMLIGTVGGDSDPLTGNEKVNFSNVNVYIGDWADYYYCEFEKNSGASYTEDFQFSRVERNEIVFDENNMPTSCTHTHTANEDKMALYLPFNQLYTGYGWGSSPQREAEGVTVTRYFYMITYLDADGSLIEVEYVTEGQRDDTHNIANAKDIDKTHTVDGKTFGGWINVGADEVTSIAAGNRKDVTLYATYENVYYARFVDEEGNVINTQEFTKSTTALTEVTGPASATDALVFDHWEVRNADGTSTPLENYNFKNANGDITIYPYYNVVTDGSASLGITGVDVDGDGVVDHYTIEAVDAGNIGADVEIPGEINGVPVKVITDLSGGWASNVENVVIKEGVEEINAQAFGDTQNLKTVELPSTITKIDNSAFAGDLSNIGSIIGYEKVLTITYNGTMADWAVVVANSNKDGNQWEDGLAVGTTVVCEDGTYTLSEKNGFLSYDYVWTPDPATKLPTN